jgi:hypothetical protein
MKELVAIAKEADSQKDSSKSDKSVHQFRNEPERQPGSLRRVINNIRHDGGTPSIERIATELSSTRAAPRASVLLALQRTHGNRYVQRVVAGIQAKLKLGQPGDSYEQEADRVAEQIMRMKVPWNVRSEDHQIKRAVMTHGNTEKEGSPELLHHIERQRGGGQPIDPGIRAEMEAAFGSDFGDVRVHVDREAQKTAAVLDARAFTFEKDIWFGRGERLSDKRLLAHELTHVVQQSVGRLGIQRAVALTDDDYKVLAKQLHEAMAGLGTDEEAIYVALQKLEKDAAAIAKLKKVYKDTYRKDLEAEIRSEMSEEELRLALDLIGIKAEPKKGEMVGGTPGTDDEYKAAAKKLYAAMKGAGTDEEAIFAVLIPFKRDAAKLNKLKATYQSELSGGLTGKGLEKDIKDEMSGDELAYALYLLNAPPPATPSAPTAETAAGTEKHKATADGEVTVRTGVGYDTYTGGYAVGYKGGLAAESRWLQFIWCEVLATKADGSVKHIAETGLPTSNGTMDLTTDPSAPRYKVDSGSASSPFYEAGFTHIRTSTGTTIYDRPYEFTNIIHKQFDKGATNVVERDYFNVFLVRDYKTIYHITVVVEWVYTSKTSVTRKTKFKSGKKVDAMPSEMRKQLIKEYSKFEYIR